MSFLVGNASTIQKLENGDAPAAIVSSWKAELDAFHKIRAKYLLYH
jgi:uncharacterized protein YbbC (DUF1343 family)